MKKASFLFALFAACGILSGVFAGEASAKAAVLKFNSVKSSADKMYGYWADFCKRIETESKGTLKVQIFPSETLGKTADMLEAASKGAAVMQDCDTTCLADYVPDLSIFMLPYMIKEPEQIEKLWKSEVGQELSRKLEKKGLRLVTVVYFGTRNLIANRPVTSRDDTKNMKIRCAPTKMWNTTVQILGGHPTNTAWSETYNALSQGVADGAESPYSLLYSAKLYEPCKYLAHTNHLVAHTAIAMSEKVYQSLPPEAQAAIDKIGSEYPAIAIEEVRATEGDFRKLLEDGGVKITEVDKAPFIEAAREAVKQFPEWTPGLYDRVLAAISD